MARELRMALLMMYKVGGCVCVCACMSIYFPLCLVQRMSLKGEEAAPSSGSVCRA